ncbi:MAG: hypothetical protein JO334_18655 [Verrucomicrobia bacterium]|nr:hypothetical protein [Verrucomicrobiota bacterium]
MLIIFAVNHVEIRTAPGRNHSTGAHDGEQPVLQARLVDVFDQPIAGPTPDSDGWEALLLACHSHIGETIHEEDGDRFLRIENLRRNGTGDQIR